jgi:hypothetical protein
MTRQAEDEDRCHEDTKREIGATSSDPEEQSHFDLVLTWSKCLKRPYSQAFFQFESTPF